MHRSAFLKLFVTSYFIKSSTTLVTCAFVQKYSHVLVQNTAHIGFVFNEEETTHYWELNYIILYGSFYIEAQGAIIHRLIYTQALFKDVLVSKFTTTRNTAVHTLTVTFSYFIFSLSNCKVNFLTLHLQINIIRGNSSVLWGMIFYVIILKSIQNFKFHWFKLLR